jgi:hypothetical protein
MAIRAGSTRSGLTFQYPAIVRPTYTFRRARNVLDDNLAVIVLPLLEPLQHDARCLQKRSETTGIAKCNSQTRIVGHKG